MTRLLGLPALRWRCLAVVVLVVAALTLAGCTSGSPGAVLTPTQAATPAATPAATASTQPSSAVAAQRKVLVIVEENKTFAETIGTPAAPYLNGLAKTYGLATAMDAGYPPGCPSLAAYILMTSGSTHDICDDRNPSAHPLGGDNLFDRSHPQAGSGAATPRRCRAPVCGRTAMTAGTWSGTSPRPTTSASPHAANTGRCRWDP